MTSNICYLNAALYLVTNTDNIIVDLSQAFSDFTGYSSMEVLQKHISEVINRLLRINCNLHDTGEFYRQKSFYLFTKSLDVREVSISINFSEIPGQKHYTFFEQTDSRL